LDTQIGYTPLLYAVQNGHTECARLLLNKGADVHAKDGVRPSARTQPAL